MTTIACDGKRIACDSQCTIGDMKGTVTKFWSGVVRGARVLVIVAGDIDKLTSVVAAVKAELPVPSEECTVVVVRGGEITVHDDGKHWDMAAPYAAGSGETIARTAMHLGCDAVRAVRVATELDLHSGGRVHAWDVGTLRKVM